MNQWMGTPTFFMTYLVKAQNRFAYSEWFHNLWIWLADRWHSFFSASVLTAFGTLTLAVVTYKVMQATKLESERNHFFNLHQMNLKYRAGFYEEVLMFADGSLANLEKLALGLGIKFNSVDTPYTQQSTQPLLNERLIGIRLQLHASVEIRFAVQEWVTTWVTERDKLKSLIPELDAYNDPSGLVELTLSVVQDEFQSVHKSLEIDLKKILAAMMKELHPTMFMPNVNIEHVTKWRRFRMFLLRG